LITYLEAIREAMWEEMKDDETVFIMGQDVGVYGGAFKITEGFLAEFGPDRVIDTPISEAAIVGAAIGAAHMGLKPVCEMQFIDFIAPAFDMIVNFAAKVRYRTGVGAGLVIRGPCGGGARAGPFHSQNVESYFANVAGLKMVAPATAHDAKGLLKAAIRDPDPVLYFEHKFLYRRIKEELPGGKILVPIGKARTHREGDDLTLVTYGAMVYKAEEAAELVAREDGAGVEILDLRRDHRAGVRGGVRMAGRAHPARHRARHARSVLATARGLLSSSDRGHRDGCPLAAGVLNRKTEKCRKSM